jgi:hypothetical protein
MDIAERLPVGQDAIPAASERVHEHLLARTQHADRDGLPSTAVADIGPGPGIAA